MAEKYIPHRGDIVFLNFDPQVGKEQLGRRPAVVLSPQTYNEKVGLAIFCPITSKKKGYPFEVEIFSSDSISGVVLSDHIKSLDWRERQAEKKGELSELEIEEVLGKLGALLSKQSS